MLPHSRLCSRATHWARWLLRGRRPDAFAGLGLQADLLRLRSEDLGQPLADGVAVREAWAAGRRRCSRGSRSASPARPHGVQAARSISAESRPRFAGSVSGNIWPMSPRAAAPSRASVTACSSTSASLWPDRLPVVGDVDPAQPQRSAGRGGACRVRFRSANGPSVVAVLPCVSVGTACGCRVRRQRPHLADRPRDRRAMTIAPRRWAICGRRHRGRL